MNQMSFVSVTSLSLTTVRVVQSSVTLTVAPSVRRINLQPNKRNRQKKKLSTAGATTVAFIGTFSGRGGRREFNDIKHLINCTSERGGGGGGGAVGRGRG